MNTFLSISDQKNNEVVRLLTIFSAFFLPLTFIAGIYGMNFKIMPELNWKYGYLFSILFMLAIVIVIYSWFRRKKIL
jgi:magnesium transporter